jgi:hypothetical protein
MNIRLITTVIIITSFFTGFLTGVLMGKQLEKKENQKIFFMQKEINKIA